MQWTPRFLLTGKALMPVEAEEVPCRNSNRTTTLSRFRADFFSSVPFGENEISPCRSILHAHIPFT